MAKASAGVQVIEADTCCPPLLAAPLDGAQATERPEVEPERVEGLPVLGVDPVRDYAPLLEASGFIVDWYRESEGWADRVTATFTAVTEAMPTLIAEMGETAASSLGLEAALTLQCQPYRRRVVVAAHVS